VPTYNRRALLEKCLDGLLNQSISPYNYEIIVVDDCSSDDTQKYMKEKMQKAINLVYIRHLTNQGRVSTRNDGIIATQGEIIIFLDNDNVPCREFIEAHQQYHENNGDEHIAVVGNTSFPKEIIDSGNFARYMQGRYLGFRKQRELKKIDLSNLPPQYFAGSNSSARKEDLFAVGLFDTRFRYYGGEDEIMGYNLNKLGTRIVFGKEAVSWHYDNVSISRYKTKYIESGREAIPKIIAFYPDYLKTTRAKWLLSINYSQDNLPKIIKKTMIKFIVNPEVLKIFEKWAIATDRYSWAYYPIIYRLLLGSWLLKGFKSKKRGFGLVTYNQ